jgi:hypothetical protein
MSDLPDLEELRRLEAAATPGPWRYDTGPTTWNDGDIVAGDGQDRTWVTTSGPDGDINPPDAEFIVALRNAAPALLASAAALEPSVEEPDLTTAYREALRVHAQSPKHYPPSVEELAAALHRLHMPMEWRWWDPTTEDTRGTSVAFAAAILRALRVPRGGGEPGAKG